MRIREGTLLKECVGSSQEGIDRRIGRLERGREERGRLARVRESRRGRKREEWRWRQKGRDHSRKFTVRAASEPEKVWRTRAPVPCAYTVVTRAIV